MLILLMVEVVPRPRVGSSAPASDDNAGVVDLTPLVCLRRLMIHWDPNLHLLKGATAPGIYSCFVTRCFSHLPLGVDELWFHVSQDEGVMASFPWSVLEGIALSKQRFKLTFVVLDDGLESFIHGRMPTLAAERRLDVRGGRSIRGSST